MALKELNKIKQKQTKESNTRQNEAIKATPKQKQKLERNKHTKKTQKAAQKQRKNSPKRWKKRLKKKKKGTNIETLLEPWWKVCSETGNREEVVQNSN